MANLTRLSSSSKAIAMMILAIFFLSSMDAVVKGLSSRYDVMQIVWVRYIGQMLLAGLLVWRTTGVVLRTRSPGLQLLRSALLYIGTLSFFIGFSNIDLAAATAILQVNPLVIAIAAWILLGEQFGWRRLLGVCIGLAGAIIIIRPGTSVFSPYALFPLIAALSFSGYAIATRFLSRTEGIAASFFFTTILGTIIASIVVPFRWSTPALEDILPMALVAMFGTAGQYLIIRALFLAEASVVSPFGYMALVFSAIYGMIFFNEFPDFWTYVGAFVIAASGLYIWHREATKTGGKIERGNDRTNTRNC